MKKKEIMNKFEIIKDTKEQKIKDLKKKKNDFDSKNKKNLLKFSKSIPNIFAKAPEQQKLIILIDIVGFSKSTTRQQVYNIYLFQRYLTIEVLTSKFSFSSKIKINQFIPTGDGCYIVADKCAPQYALKFLITLISGFKEMQDADNNPLALRVSALIGECVQFMDIAKHINFVGEGMNEASRILSGGQSFLEEKFLQNHKSTEILDAKKYSRNSLYLGDSLTTNINDFKKNCDEFFYFENVKDKHGKMRNITVLQNVKV